MEITYDTEWSFCHIASQKILLKSSEINFELLNIDAYQSINTALQIENPFKNFFGISIPIINLGDYLFPKT